MSCWAIADAINKITMGQNDATNKRCYFGNNPNGKWGIGIYTSQWTQNSVAADTTVLGQWYYLTLTMNSSINTSNFYIDGGKEVLQKAYSSYEIPSNLMIGRLGLNSSFDWDGLIDEVRYSAVAKSAEWIKFEYYNMYSSDQELIISSETGGTGKFGKK